MRSWVAALGFLLVGAADVGQAADAAGAAAGLVLTSEQAEDRAAFVATLRKARQGDADSQWQVGRTYARLGEDAKALPMITAAAALGHVAAASLAGTFHEEGRGTAKSRDEAFRWYRQAAEQGDAAALAALARLLPPGNTEVMSYLHRSANAGNPDGQYQLGHYLAAAGVSQNLAEAGEWFKKAAAQGHVGAQVAAALLMLEGQGGKPDRQAGMAVLEKAAAMNDPVANFLLGREHLQAEKSNPDAARRPLRLAATAGHREAQYLYGALLADSKAEADKRAALEWLDKAQRAGHVAAMNRLGELLRDYVADQQHFANARELFLLAAEKGNTDAMYNLALMQNQGQGGARDTFSALKWFSRAADEKHEKAAAVLESLLGSALKTSSLGLKGFWQQ
ncbi:MAG: SEL1-like repeat protein [Rhodocyclales bacterium]|nr:SEL1-like repeat protein [Rhodocyclales bacterium]